MSAGGVSKTSAATSLVVAKSLAVKKLAEHIAKVLNSCVHFALRKAIVRASCQIVSSSSLLPVIIGVIGHLASHEDNAKETRTSPIVS